MISLQPSCDLPREDRDTLHPRKSRAWLPAALETEGVTSSPRAAVAGRGAAVTGHKTPVVTTHTSLPASVPSHAPADPEVVESVKNSRGAAVSNPDRDELCQDDKKADVKEKEVDRGSPGVSAMGVTVTDPSTGVVADGNSHVRGTTARDVEMKVRDAKVATSAATAPSPSTAGAMDGKDSAVREVTDVQKEREKMGKYREDCNSPTGAKGNEGMTRVKRASIPKGSDSAAGVQDSSAGAHHVKTGAHDSTTAAHDTSTSGPQDEGPTTGVKKTNAGTPGRERGSREEAWSVAGQSASMDASGPLPQRSVGGTTTVSGEVKMRRFTLPNLFLTVEGQDRKLEEICPGIYEYTGQSINQSVS